jgi:probable F420-dependent oxidoreductase
MDDSADACAMAAGRAADEDRYMDEPSAQRGVLAITDQLAGDELVARVDELAALGYESFWIPELFGREPIATAAFLLARCAGIRIGTGIANVYARDAHAMAQARHTLDEFSGGRFLLGLGVSNVGMNAARGHVWEPPLGKMRGFLDALDAVRVESPAAAARGALYLAAHGPQLQRLAAARSDGLITYLMPPQHIAASRARLGPRAEISAVCPTLAADDARSARDTIRAALGYYMTLDYYHREWSKLGFTADDFVDGGSDRLLDTVVAWGDRAALEERVARYAEAGATRVIVLPLDAARTTAQSSLGLLAPARA